VKKTTKQKAEPSGHDLPAYIPPYTSVADAKAMEAEAQQAESNDTDAEASAEARKAQFAKLDEADEAGDEDKVLRDWTAEYLNCKDEIGPSYAQLARALREKVEENHILKARVEKLQDDYADLKANYDAALAAATAAARVEVADEAVAAYAEKAAAEDTVA